MHNETPRSHGCQPPNRALCSSLSRLCPSRMMQDTPPLPLHVLLLCLCTVRFSNCLPDSSQSSHARSGGEGLQEWRAAPSATIPLSTRGSAIDEDRGDALTMPLRKASPGQRIHRRQVNSDAETPALRDIRGYSSSSSPGGLLHLNYSSSSAERSRQSALARESQQQQQQQQQQPSPPQGAEQQDPPPSSTARPNRLRRLGLPLVSRPRRSSRLQGPSDPRGTGEPPSPAQKSLTIARPIRGSTASGPRTRRAARACAAWPSASTTPTRA